MRQREPGLPVSLEAALACSFAMTAPNRVEAAFTTKITIHKALPAKSNLACINAGCTDISESHVAGVFEGIFGYPLALSSRSFATDALDSEKTYGALCGGLIAHSKGMQPNRICQHPSDGSGKEFAEEMRIPCVGGEPILAFVKRRPKSACLVDRESVSLEAIEEKLSEDEQTNIRTFIREIKLDWGGLNIERENSCNRLYILDVSKTDMLPRGLPFVDKMDASRRLGAALQKLVRDLQKDTLS